ncbi:conserved hypothetical protein (UPF0283) [Alteracholeplasma palmae J233]|uniref:YcjF family protein n=1 Tax=Alteracholeplasma palmae (strain ATCC 49389 / J233) TaxID=1318466 RepID=U4KKG9_ALTPJ|nr:YcjF family protein [Alteracholeplasma palmae]CCV64068.1 conserved hypothetical protein (UPF0283) [Alteracholeplasma palmae J233]
MKKEKTARKFWYAIAIGVVILFLLILISSVLSVGERLSKIHAYIAYAFYGIAFILTYLLIIRPVHIVLFSPSFSVETTLDKTSRRGFRIYKKVAKRLLEQEDIPEASKESIRKAMDNKDELREVLNHTYNHYIKKRINRIVKNHAKTVMISTAISQNGRLDFFTVIVVNLRMIKEIVLVCGFRPSYKNLAKLTINVFTTALIAEGLENIDIQDILPQSTMNTLGEIPLIKPVLSSVTQGISNALLTLRIGIVTRKYLFSDAQEITKETIRRGALIEAAKLLPGVIAEGIILFPKKLFGLFNFGGKKDKTSDENIDKE